MRRAATLLALGVLSWLTLPVGSVRAADATPKPTIRIASEGSCIAPPEEMRRNHMEMLKHQRDRTLRQGMRGEKASLNECIACHASNLMQVAQAQTKRAAGEPASRLQRWGMLIDTTKCAAGCDACVKACAAENGINETVADPRQASQWIRKIDIKDPKNGRQHSLPMMCQHCAEPPCVDVCPTGASMKCADGIVLVDRHICIGCRYCMMACPYKARSFVHQPLTRQNPEVPRGIGCVDIASTRA